MKKSTLLSLATAGAIVATSVGTFATWDTMNVSSTSTLTLDKPITMTMTSAQLTTTREAGTDPVYTGTHELTVENLPTGVTADTYKIVYEAKAYTDYNTKTEADGVTVSATENTPAATLDEKHEISVEVKPTDAAKQIANDGTELTIEVTATLQKK